MLPGIERGGLESTETEVQTRSIGHWAWKGETSGGTGSCKSGYFRTAGVRQSHQLGGLVEGFTGSIIHGFAQHFVLANTVHPDQLGMPAGDQQSHKGKGGRLFFQHGRQQVAFHMVNAQRRHAPGEGERPSACAPDQQRTDQTRAGGVNHTVHIPFLNACLGEHLAHQRNQPFDVVTGGQLGHDPAVHAVQVDLAEQGVGQQASLAVVQGDAGFITGGFNTQNAHRVLAAISCWNGCA